MVPADVVYTGERGSQGRETSGRPIGCFGLQVVIEVDQGRSNKLRWLGRCKWWAICAHQ